MGEVKKFKDWKGDLSSFLQVDDVVDTEFFDYFLNVLPPAYWTSMILQIGEPQNHIEGRATYSTLKRTSEGWAYAGHCFKGETVHRECLILRF